MDDNLLIKKYLSGDKNSLEMLLEKHLQSIFDACFRVCLDENDANDITQNVLIKIIKNLNKFSFQSKFKTWYYTIAYNESITFLKKKSGTENIDDYINQVYNEEDFGEKIDIEQIKLDVTLEINKLPLIDRNIILFFYFDELKIKEISNIMGINENTIKTKISRIKQKLKLNLSKYENIN